LNHSRKRGIFEGTFFVVKYSFIFLKNAVKKTETQKKKIQKVAMEEN